MISFEVLTKTFVRDSTSQFQNFCVDFHKFHALFSTGLSHLGLTITSFAQDGFQNAHGCAQNTEDGFGFNFSTVVT
jgi:hypothetical protein